VGFQIKREFFSDLLKNVRFKRIIYRFVLLTQAKRIQSEDLSFLGIFRIIAKREIFGRSGNGKLKNNECVGMRKT
jgi:hypothetical protein